MTEQDSTEFEMAKDAAIVRMGMLSTTLLLFEVFNGAVVSIDAEAVRRFGAHIVEEIRRPENGVFNV